MPNKHNQQQVEIIQEKLSRAKSVAVIDYSGTNVKEQVTLRSSLTEAGSEMFVTKNTLIDIAAGKGKLTDSLSGMNAIVLCYEDAVAGLKKLFEFQKKTNKLTIKQGLYENKVLSAQEIETLSKLPSKEDLISTLISRLQGPAYGLVNVLKAGQRDLVYALKAVAEKK